MTARYSWAARPLPALVALLAVLLTGGCVRRVEEARVPAPAPEGARQAPPTADTLPLPHRGGIRSRAMFSLDTQVEGSLRPGEPIRLVAIVRAHLASEQAEVRITMPEWEDLRQNDWMDFQMRGTGIPYPPVVDTLLPIEPGQEVRLEATLSIPIPGYYQVVASAVDRADRLLPLMVQGELVQDVTHRSLWLWISPEGGRVTEHFDLSLLPPGAQPQPGPLRFPLSSARYNSFGPPPPEMRRETGRYGIVYGTVMTGDGRLLQGAAVKVRTYFVECGTGRVAEGEATTDAMGNYRLRLALISAPLIMQRNPVTCLAIRVEPPAGSGLHPVVMSGVSLRFPPGAGAEPDSARVDVVLGGR